MQAFPIGTWLNTSQPVAAIGLAARPSPVNLGIKFLDTDRNNLQTEPRAVAGLLRPRSFSRVCQVGCAALLGFTWLNYQPGNPALSPVVCFVGRPAASDAYATPPSRTTRLCCLNRTPFMLLPLINIFTLHPEAAQQQPRFLHSPWGAPLCSTANQCQTRRVDLSGQRGGEPVPHVSGGH